LFFGRLVSSAVSQTSDFGFFSINHPPIDFGLTPRHSLSKKRKIISTTKIVIGHVVLSVLSHSQGYIPLQLGCHYGCLCGHWRRKLGALVQLLPLAQGKHEHDCSGGWPKRILCQWMPIVMSE
jgi:hypothetical protein